MKRLFLAVATLMLCLGANAQFLNRLIRSAANAAENAVERQVDKKVEDGIDKAFNPDENDNNSEKQNNANNNKKDKSGKSNDNKNNSGWTCPACGNTGNTGKFCAECGAKRPDGNSANVASTPAKPATATIYQKCDFVPGDEVFFDDPVEGEQLGEFPSKWDALGGNAEVAELNGEQVIAMTIGGTIIFPYMTEQNFLGDIFTIEFDLWGTEFKEEESSSLSTVLRMEFNNDTYFRLIWNYFDHDDGFGRGPRTRFDIGWHNGNTGEFGGNTGETEIKLNEWNHIAISFNKRALKFYLNGNRLVAVPNAKQPESFKFDNDLWTTKTYIKNIRMAKGAVPLYNRLQSDGKIITYAITFETGKADLKPESTIEIMRIAKLMKEDTSVKFEVQGHCDNTGSDNVNDPLSQKRAEAIVAALVEQGIAANRLTAVGKGSHSPIADNSTDEGRAKNRRVEFVKK